MLIRMISSIHKWDNSIVNRNDAYIPADAISDLRTKDNKLSVWAVNSVAEIDDIVVALALGRDNVSKLSLITIDDTNLPPMGISLDNEKGEAPGLCEEILSKHHNLVELDYWRIGFFADYLLTLVQADQLKTYTRNDVKNLLTRYKDNGKIITDDVKAGIQKDMGWVSQQ